MSGRFVSTELKSAALSGGICFNGYEKDGEFFPALAPRRIEGEPVKDVIFAAHSFTVDRFFAATADAVYVSAQGTRMVQMFDEFPGDDPFFYEEQQTDSAGYAVIGKLYTGVRHRGTDFEGLRYTDPLRCAVMRRHRLFGASDEDGYKLVWTACGTTFGKKVGLRDGGWMKLTPDLGEILALAEYGDGIVALREYGLTALKTFGSPETFSLAGNDFKCDRPLPKTLAKVGGELFFFTQSGLKAFDGANVRRVDFAYADVISDPRSAVTFGDGYYVVCKCNPADRYCVLKLGGGSEYFVDIAPNALCAADGVYCFCNDGLFKLEQGDEYVCNFYGLDFGDPRKKTIKYVQMRGKGTVEISNGSFSRTFAGGITRAGFAGTRFSAKLTGKGKTSVKLTAEVKNGI